MKSTTVISLLLAGVTVQAVAIPVNITQYEDMIKDTLEKRQILGALTSLIGIIQYSW
jgi:hypothetical protein